MAVPASRDARLFHRCAVQRYEEAQILFRANHTTGAVYLAGYGIECIMKALILSSIPSRRARSVMETFRGHRAHDYEWLRGQYYEKGGAHFPREVSLNFTLANYWSTKLRYTPGNLKLGDAEDFLAAVAAIIEWAEGRL
jgi:HEPN domain